MYKRIITPQGEMTVEILPKFTREQTLEATLELVTKAPKITKFISKLTI